MTHFAIRSRGIRISLAMTQRLGMSDRADALRAQIGELVTEYFRAAFPGSGFIPGEVPIPYAGRVFDDAELRSLVDASLDFWLTTGRFAAEFERRFAQYFGMRHALLV